MRITLFFSYTLVILIHFKAVVGLEFIQNKFGQTKGLLSELILIW